MVYNITDGTATGHLFTVSEFRNESFPTVRRGEVQTFEMAFPDSTEYEEARKFTEYAGAASYGTTLGGRPWYIEHLIPNAPVITQVVLVETPTFPFTVPDMWVLLVGAEDRTSSPGTDFRIDFDAFFLGEGDEYANRAEVKDTLGGSITGT